MTKAPPVWVFKTMMKITLSEAVSILQNSSGVMMDDCVLVDPSIEELDGDPDSEFMYLSWGTNTGCCLTFYEGANREVEVIDSSIYMYSSSHTKGDDPTKLTPLTPMIMEKQGEWVFTTSDSSFCH